MNTIYKVVRNASTGKWVVASELARSRGKKHQKIHLTKAAIISIGMLMAAGMGSSATAGTTNTLFVNDGTDTGCGAFNESSGTQVGSTSGGNAPCSVQSIAELKATGAAAGTVVINGYGTFINGKLSIDGVFDLNSHKITSLSAGTNASDAVNLSQLSPVVNALGGGAKIDATTGVVTGPTYNLTNGGTQTTVGGALTGLDNAITTINRNYKVNSYPNTADAIATGTGAIAIGGGAISGKETGTVDSIAIGLKAKADANNAIALGRLAQASGAHSSALSDSAKALSDDSLAVGYSASVAATATGGTALGANASVGENATGSVALGKDSTATEANTISVGNSTTKRKIVNVAAGTLSETSNEVVIGSQLYATNQNVTTNANNISALQSQINNGSVGLVQQNATTKKITVASEVEGDTVDFSGKKAGAAISRKLTGLSNGELSSTSTDAVTGAQLYATNQNVTANSSAIASNTSNISSLQTQINDGSIGLVKQDATTQAITVGAAGGGTSINFAGSAGGRVLTGIANGTADSDAVTIAQLKAAGLVDGNGKSLLALVYDDLTMGSAMLGGSKGTVIRNLANGSVAHGSMEAINGGQLFDFQQDVRNQMNALNGQINALNDQVSHIQEGINNGSIGGTGTGGDSASLGVGANASGDHSTAVGTGSNASGAGSTATGAGSSASGDNSTANGANAIASGGNSTANGNGAQATGNDSTASGAHAIASGEGSTANGTNAVASGNNSTALGSNSSATGSNSVALGANSTADRDNTVSVGSEGNERQITNVAAGTQATDAANWG
ncbi:hypothetical protein ISN75_07660 [Dyella marensis]|uniref:ESPR-type extended signal peptide-containing protein n=1 Tax=Dyella marensis TaxID=500610 RepID=UPI0031D7DA3B